MQVLTAIHAWKNPRITRGATLPLCLAQDGQWYVYKQEQDMRARVRDDLIANGLARAISTGTRSITGMLQYYLVLDHVSVSTNDRNNPVSKELAPSEKNDGDGPVMLWFPQGDIFVDRIANPTGNLTDLRDTSDCNPESIDAAALLRQTVAKDLVVISPGQTIVTKRYLDDDYEQTQDGFWSYDGKHLFVNGKQVEDTVLWA